MRIRIAAALAGTFLLLSMLSSGWAEPPIRADELRRHVEYLADPAREGRGLGTAGIDSAAVYVAGEFRRFGLQPGGRGGVFFQPFEANLKTGRFATRNVVAILPGRKTGARPCIVLGAHYDHLGYGDTVPGSPGAAIYPGADDNASGVAGILELAEYFASHDRLQHTLVFIAFSGEESGLLGSAYFVDHPTVPLEGVLAMINLDAVGRPDSGEVTVFGTDTAVEFDSLLSAADDEHLKIKPGGGGLGPSDQTSFVLKRIPAIQLFGAAHMDYHHPTDTPEKLHYRDFAALVRFAARTVEVLDSVPDSLTFRQPPPAGHAESHGGKRVYLGIIPDFGGSDKGMALRGTGPGSPAEKAGLMAGDVIVGLGGAEVKDIEGLFQALTAHSPGDTVEIDVLRGTGRVKLQAVLGERGSSTPE